MGGGRRVEDGGWGARGGGRGGGGRRRLRHLLQGSQRNTTASLVCVCTVRKMREWVTSTPNITSTLTHPYSHLPQLGDVSSNSRTVTPWYPMLGRCTDLPPKLAQEGALNSCTSNKFNTNYSKREQPRRTLPYQYDSQADI